MVGYACCFIRALPTFVSQRISATVSSYTYDVKRKYNGNENGHIQIYQFPFQIFRFRFVSVNVNHTALSLSLSPSASPPVSLHVVDLVSAQRRLDTHE